MLDFNLTDEQIEMIAEGLKKILIKFQNKPYTEIPDLMRELAYYVETLETEDERDYADFTIRTLLSYTKND